MGTQLAAHKGLQHNTSKPSTQDKINSEMKVSYWHWQSSSDPMNPTCIQQEVSPTVLSTLGHMTYKRWSRTINTSTAEHCYSTLLSLTNYCMYRDADKSLARSTSWCILFDGENILFDASLVMYINTTNIPPIVSINRIYETQKIFCCCSFFPSWSG